MASEMKLNEETVKTIAAAVKRNAGENARKAVPETTQVMVKKAGDIVMREVKKVC